MNFILFSNFFRFFFSLIKTRFYNKTVLKLPTFRRQQNNTKYLSTTTKDLISDNIYENNEILSFRHDKVSYFLPNQSTVPLLTLR